MEPQSSFIDDPEDNEPVATPIAAPIQAEPQLSPEDQDAASFAAMKANGSFPAPSAGGNDLDRIKANVAKMAGMKAPESDIDGYIASEGQTIDAIKAHTIGQNVAHETSTKNSPDLMTSLATSEPGKFMAGMGGQLVNMGRGVAQAFLNPIESGGVKNPNPQIQGAADNLKKQVSHTQSVIDTAGLSGKAGQFFANLLPWLAAPEVAPAAMGAAEGFAQPQGEGDSVNRFTGAAKGAVGAEAGNQVIGGAFNKAQTLMGSARKVLQNSLGTLLQQPKPVQNAVFSRAQAIIDDGLKSSTPVQVTGPEALQQAFEEHGIGGSGKLGTLQRVVEQSPSGEGAMAGVTGARPGQVAAAGEGLLRDTFGAPVAPQQVVQDTEAAAGKSLTDAVKARTNASESSFGVAGKQVASPGTPVTSDIQSLKDEVDDLIKQKGTTTGVGRKLKDFKAKLEQGVDENGAQALGPLQQANRETAINLYKKYNPQDPDNTFNNMEAGIITPLNQKLTSLLTRETPEYGQALESHIAASPEVNAQQYGAVGRLAEGGADVGSRLTSLSNEFLADTARPTDIHKLSAQLGKIDPNVVPQLVGTRLETMFTKATQDLQSGPNPWGGAKFINQVMGNSLQRANLEATIKTLPQGAQKWAAWNKLATVLKATGKRKAAGSETAMNLSAQDEMAALPGKFSSNPLRWADETLSNWAAKRNGAELARVFTHPQAAAEMQKLTSLSPNSPKARLITASILSLVQGTPSATPEQSTTVEAPPTLQTVNPQSPNDYVSKTVIQESGGNPNAKAKTSGAVGAGQFIPRTWMHMIDKYHPELMVGKTTRQILELRKDASLAREMTGHYGTENAEALIKAGLPVNDTTKYLSHFLGPTDTKRLLNAKIGTPAAQVLSPASIRANRHVLAGKNAEDVLRWAQRAMGDLPEPSAGPK